MLPRNWFTRFLLVCPGGITSQGMRSASELLEAASYELTWGFFRGSVIRIAEANCVSTLSSRMRKAAYASCILEVGVRMLSRFTDRCDLRKADSDG